MLFCALLPGRCLRAQDPVFSQFYAAPLQLNPAFAGITFAPRLSLNYRNQYPTWPNAYVTYAAAYEQGLEQLNSGIGLMFSSDVAGDGVYRTNKAAAVFGYQVQLSETFHAKFGVEGGMLQSSVDWDRLVFGDQIDPREGPNNGPDVSQEERPASLAKTSFDIGAGVLFHGGPYYGGLAVHHLNRPDESLLEINDNLLVGRPMRFTVHGGAQFAWPSGNKRGGEAFISPNVLYIRQAELAQLNLGAYAGAGRFFGGLWYRHAFSNPDAFIFLAGLREGVLRLGYSLDLTVSRLASVPGGLGGTHELSLAINFSDSRELQRRRRQSRWNDCFGMFR